jgi:hypothetical protein
VFDNNISASIPFQNPLGAYGCFALRGNEAAAFDVMSHCRHHIALMYLKNHVRLIVEWVIMARKIFGNREQNSNRNKIATTALRVSSKIIADYPVVLLTSVIRVVVNPFVALATFSLAASCRLESSSQE